jgi:transposase InsO family protein
LLVDKTAASVAAELQAFLKKIGGPDKIGRLHTDNGGEF